MSTSTNWRQMAEKLDASVCVLENLIMNSVRTKDSAKPVANKSERSVALQFPEDFFQPASSQVILQQQQTCAPIERKDSSCRSTNATIEMQIPASKEIEPLPIPAPEILPETQLKLHQSILNFKQFNCSLKPLLAILEFVLQDVSGAHCGAHMSLIFPTHAISFRPGVWRICSKTISARPD